MRLSAGRSTFAIITPAADKIGSSHFKLRGRTTLRGTAFSPWPNWEASVHVSCTNPRTLHPASGAASCAYTAGPRLTSRMNASNLSSIRKRLAEAVCAVLRSSSQHFAGWSTPGFLVGWVIFIAPSKNRAVDVRPKLFEDVKDAIKSNLGQPFLPVLGPGALSCWVI